MGLEFSKLQEPQTMNPGTLEAKAEASAQLPVPSVHISNASKEVRWWSIPQVCVCIWSNPVC